MGGRLRRLTMEFKKQMIDDGKSLGVKNRLTDKKIDQIQSYYGNTLKENKNVEEMRQAVRAFFTSDPLIRNRSTDCVQKLTNLGASITGLRLRAK